MATQWSELLAEKTPRQQFQALIQALSTKGWPATAWQPGDVGRTLVEISAEVLADLSKAAVKIAKSGFLSTASGQWLDLIAEEFYGIQRKPATFSERRLTLTLADSAAAVNKGAGEVIVSDASGRYRFHNKQTISILPGATNAQQVVFRAEGAGTEYNTVVPTILNVAIPGMTVSVPADDSIVSANDTETDAQLRQRCRDTFPQQGLGATAAAYSQWALEASTEVRRTQVLPATGDGVVRLRLASDTAAVSEPARAAVEAYIGERDPLTAGLEVEAATPVLVDVTATLYAPEEHRQSARGEAEANLAKLMATLPIGAGGTVYRMAIIEELMRPDGVVNVVLTSPVADVPVPDGHVAQIGIVQITTMAV